ncbi:MAG TPA: transposase, partial [Gemmatimonadales bacterium]
LTAFATNTPPGGPGTQIPDLELRHRRRARAEDRIRCAKDTGLTNLPLHTFSQNQIWCALVQLAADLLAWTQLLALTEHPARRWEPKRLRLRLLSAAGRLARSSRRTTLHLARTGPWTALLLHALNRLRTLPDPG